VLLGENFPADWRRAILSGQLSMNLEERLKFAQAAFVCGGWRAPIFRDLVLEEVRSRKRSQTLLDVGCGRGFDDSRSLQQSLIAEADSYIGVEPDVSIQVAAGIKPVHRTVLEDAPIEPESVDVAFAVMVVEHLEDPVFFFNKIHQVLKPGGVFWVFTMELRHYFALASWLMESLSVKDAYLRAIRNGVEAHYDNYPTRYRCNTQSSIYRLTSRYSTATLSTLNRPGLHDHYVPKVFRPVLHLADSATIALGLPGPLLLCRFVK